ncbi:MAG TPA: alpha/beta hydrolase, partial [Acidimicrobiales bacterium]|nr:alpha/beta hydrolase [Acidimicrobiales bacterium]
MPNAIIPVGGDRRLEVLTGGKEGGRTVVFHYGTPMGLVPFDPLSAVAAERGLRLVVIGRPGYGDSTPQPGRSVADVSSDVASVLDGMGVDEFFTIGWSGGGPHALACSALLRDRCVRTATIASVAPFDLFGPGWMADMGEENVEEFNAAVAGEPDLVDFLDPFAAQLVGIDADGITGALGDLLPPVDKANLQGPFADFMAASMRAAVAKGIAGWRDDDLAFVKPWGFDLAEVGPLTIWQGSDDRMVPFAHGQWLAKAIPSARANLLPGEGHLSLAVA